MRVYSCLLTILLLKKKPATYLEVESFDLDADFSTEPTDDLMADTLKAGLADGTLVLSESEYDNESSSDVECECPFCLIASM